MYENEFYTENGYTAPQAENAYPYMQTAATEHKRRRSGKKHGARAKTAALVLCCSLLSGAVGAAAVKGMSGSGSTTLVESSRPAQTVNVSYTDTGKEMTAAEVYEANVNSTVGITTSITTNYFGFKTSSAAAGSGFIISENGYIVTNYHVIEDSSSVTVTTYDGESYDASLVGYDESNDLAVLKIDAEGLTPVVLGDSDALRVGDEVVAIGNPLGELTFSLTKGSVSALNREITLSSGVTMDLIQTDAAINSGNSGGALFNMYGEVVGITNAKYSGSGSSSASIDNIGFAIPLNSVKSIITGIIEKGYYAKPYIGVTLQDAADAVLIYSVEQGSPADEAGLQANDIVTAANGEAVTAADELCSLVRALTPGDELQLTVSRGGEKTVLTVTVGEQKQSTLPQSESQTESWPGTDEEQMFENFGFPFGFSSGDTNRG